MLRGMLARIRITLPDRPGALGRVGSALGAAGADWAAVLEYRPDGEAAGVVATSIRCPRADAVPLGWPLRLSTPAWPQVAGAALVPLHAALLGLVVVRDTGAPFHRSELWRLEQVGRIVGPALAVVSAPHLA
jgi:hypothetical protein